MYAIQHVGGYTPFYERITPKVLARHLSGDITVGTYIVWDTDKARTLVFDIDDLDEKKPKLIAERLLELGVPSRSIAREFSGSKGFHVWVPTTVPVSAALLRHLGNAVTALAGVDCEVFPKQDKVHKLGNLVKLPAGLHRGSAQWSKMLDPWPQPMGPAVLKGILDGLPAPTMATSGERPEPLECMARIQEGPGEGWRNHGLFHLATMLYRQGVSPENVALVVRATYDKMDQSDFSESEVEALLESASRSGPICSTLPKEIQCEHCPVRHTKGLYTKPGQLAYGAEHELAVVEIGKRRKSGEVELIHPDLAFGLVTPKKVPPRG